MGNIEVSVFCRDLTDEVEIYDHVESIDYLCDEEKEELIDDIMCTGMPIVTEFRQRAFLQCLEAYLLGRHPEYEKLEEVVRAVSRECVIDRLRGSVTVCHGIGYEWIDQDLLGGSGDGTELEAFEKFCGSSFGIRFHFDHTDCE